MTQICPENICTGCGGCNAVCSHGAIVMMPDTEGFLRPQIDATKCVDCGLCRRVCPAVNPGQPCEPQQAFAAWIEDPEIRDQSSSGGVFSALALDILERGGLVAGAAWTDSSCTTVAHRLIDNPADLPPLRGSKYLQSQVPPEIYRGIAKALRSQRPVLFTGTPCQVAAIRRMPWGTSPLLIAVEIICHGVPSPLVWQRWNAAGRGPVNFRSKHPYGWESYSLREGSRSHRAQYHPYMRLFLADAISRPSCAQCPAKAGRSQADITLGDLWGASAILPHTDIPTPIATAARRQGITLILTHTPAGTDAIRDVTPQLQLHPIDPESALRYNPSWRESSRANPERQAALTAPTPRALRDQANRLSPLPPLLLRLKIHLHHLLHP